MEGLRDPLQHAQRLFFMNAGCVHDAPGQVDRSYVERMRNLLGRPAPRSEAVAARIRCERYRGGRGVLGTDQLSCSQPLRRANWRTRHAQYFEWAASVHPYRRDCVERLEAAVGQGARAVKWLPAAMGMDPASNVCDPLLRGARAPGSAADHARGPGTRGARTDTQELGNPLRLRRALDHGVRVVVAHCASLGQDRDTDRGAERPGGRQLRRCSRG